MAVIAVPVLGAVKEGYGQRVYATEVISTGSGVTNPGNAVSPSPGIIEPSATPRARIAVSGSGSSGSIRLHFESNIPANTAIWVRVSDRSTTGIGGGSITASAMIGSSVATGSSADYFEMNDGAAYYRVSANAAFDGVRITATSNLLGAASINIHYAFIEPPNTECTEILGFNVSSTLGSSISNPAQAVDGNLNTAATFAPAPIVGGVMTQTVYFSRLSNVGDAATVTFSIPPAILSLGLFNGITIRTYNGNTLVSNVQLSSLLSVDVLGLLGSGEKYTVSHSPGGRFDRISFEYNAGLLLASNLNLYEIDVTPAAPTVPIAFPDVVEVCDGESANLSAKSNSEGSVLRWYDVDGLLLKESSGGSDTSYITDPLPYVSATDTTFIHVAAAWDAGCPSESERTVIAIIVNPKPAVSPITGDTSICEKETTVLSSETADGVWNSLDEAVATIDASGVVTGVSIGSTTIQYTVTDPNSLCATTVEMEITVLPQPGRPYLTITDVQN